MPTSLGLWCSRSCWSLCWVGGHGFESPQGALSLDLMSPEWSNVTWLVLTWWCHLNWCQVTQMIWSNATWTVLTWWCHLTWCQVTQMIWSNVTWLFSLDDVTWLMSPDSNDLWMVKCYLICSHLMMSLDWCHLTQMICEWSNVTWLDLPLDLFWMSFDFGVTWIDWRNDQIALDSLDVF